MATLVLLLLLLTALGIPLGLAMAKLYARERYDLVERSIHRIIGVVPRDMTAREYLFAVLWFNFAGFVVLLLIQRVQASLPLNPLALGNVAWPVAINTAVSFVTNTNWQAYAGETTMSFFVQMFGLTTQNFASAGTGMAVLIALTRGLSSGRLGNFWVDLVRSIVHVLLPLALVLALVLAAQGVVQTFTGAENGIALGPVASQVAIKQLGTNGGGFYNVNSAHPLENPTPLSNFAEMLAILLIPAALCFTFGALVKDRRQGVALYAAMLVLFVPLACFAMWAEQGNMEGKEVRFGEATSALWAVVTTAASNGSVNSMLDSFTPLGGLAPLWLMQLGEVVFGGVGSGLYGMLIYVFVAVFIAGLMIGRTPEYLGKKIEVREMVMACIVILLPSAAILLGTAIGVSTNAGLDARGNPGVHGFSEILFAFSSGAANNGAAFAGLTASGWFYAIGIGVAMLIGRYGVIVPVLLLAGDMAKKKIAPPNAGTLPTHTPMFVMLLVATIVLIGALTFVPALALGPVAEHMGAP